MKFSCLSIIALSIILNAPITCWSAEKAPDSKYYVKQLEIDPNNCFNNEQLAITLEVEGNYEKAINQFKKTLEICEETSWIRLQMGVSYILSNRHEQGLLEMDRAILVAEEKENQESAQAIRDEVQLWENYLYKNK